MGHCVSRRIGSAAVCGLCLLIAFGGLGCARREPVPVAQAAAPAPPPPAPAREVVICKIERETAYDRGLKAYEAGESKRAMALWREAAGDAELAAALEMFDAWTKKSPPGGSGEDARFLVPLLKSYKPGFALKEQKAAMDRDCAKKLTEREEQVRRSLQQQVKALETIHQQIQEKKKGLTNY